MEELERLLEVQSAIIDAEKVHTRERRMLWDGEEDSIVGAGWG